MMDFLQKFKMYFVDLPDYWKLSDLNMHSEYIISNYPLSFKDRLYQGHYTNFDANGLPMFPSRTGTLVHFCTGMCSFAFAHWEEFLSTGNSKHSDVVIKVADYLITMGVRKENNSIMLYDYDSDEKVNGVSCAMNQGESISVLCRAYGLTKKSIYIEAALEMAIPFEYDYGNSGVKGRLKNNALWYLEGGKQILNGHIYALFGLADLYKISNEEWVGTLLSDGVKSVNDSIEMFDNGFWSWYWLNEPFYIASAMYHNLHICQLNALYAFYGFDKLKFYSNKFSIYAQSPLNRANAAFNILKAKIKKNIN